MFTKKKSLDYLYGGDFPLSIKDKLNKDIADFRSRSFHLNFILLGFYLKATISKTREQTLKISLRPFRLQLCK